jgi:hypothetical protein
MEGRDEVCKEGKEAERKSGNAIRKIEVSKTLSICREVVGVVSY